MKIDALVFVAYAVLLAVVVPGSTLNLLVFAALLGACVTWLTGARHFYLSFQWFRSHSLQAFTLAGMAALSVLFPFILAPMLLHSAPWPISHLPEVLAQSPVTFLWFWLFVAAGTRLRERKINELVERRLAKRKSLGGKHAGPRED